MIRSKVLESPYKDFIDSELIKGTSYAELSDILKTEYDFEISHMTLSRYHHKYLNAQRLEMKVEPVKIERISIDKNKYLENLKWNFSHDDYRKIFDRSLSELIINQLAIVDQKQRLHMKGDWSFPAKEIASLKQLIELKKHFNPLDHSQPKHLFIDDNGDLQPIPDKNLNDVGKPCDEYMRYLEITNQLDKCYQHVDHGLIIVPKDGLGGTWYKEEFEYHLHIDHDVQEMFLKNRDINTYSDLDFETKEQFGTEYFEGFEMYEFISSYGDDFISGFKNIVALIDRINSK